MISYEMRYAFQVKMLDTSDLYRHMFLVCSNVVRVVSCPLGFTGNSDGKNLA